MVGSSQRFPDPIAVFVFEGAYPILLRGGVGGREGRRNEKRKRRAEQGKREEMGKKEGGKETKNGREDEDERK